MYLFKEGVYNRLPTMNTPLINYIVFYENTPNAFFFLASHSPLNAAKDFILQNRAGTSDTAIVVRAEANPSDTKRFQNIGGSWSELRSELPDSDPKTDTSASTHLPASSPAGDRRMVRIKSVSIFYASLYGGVGYGLAMLVGAMVAAFTMRAAMGVAGGFHLIVGGIFAATAVAIVIGAVGGALGALFYNVISAAMGGLRVELADDDNLSLALKRRVPPA